MSEAAELTITAEYAALVAPFVSKDEARFNLTGFYVQEHPTGGALIVATDGAALGVFHDTFAHVAVPGIVTLSKTTLAACKSDRTLVIEGDRASVYEMWNEETREGLLVAAQDGAVLDAEYPDWRAVVPNLPAETEPATYSGRLLEKFKKITRPEARSATIRAFAPIGGGATIILTARDDFLGVLMPLKAHVEDRMPAWLPPYRPRSGAEKVDLTNPDPNNKRQESARAARSVVEDEPPLPLDPATGRAALAPNGEAAAA